MHKTYQDAKIECPNACICRDRVSGMFFAMPSKEGTILSDTSEFAEAKDYCMTVEEFLNSGRRLDVGDLFINCFGQAVEVKGENVDTVNIPHEYDNARHILRAAALEKPKRTKVEYEKVEFEPNEIWKAFKEHQEVGYLYVNTSDGFECLLDGVFNLAMAISQGDQLYRRIETEIDERQEFIDAACNEVNATIDSYAAEDFAKLYDSGKFKLVN